MFRIVKDGFGVINNNIILHVETSTYIPVDALNTDYANYLLWIANGNAPEPAV